jgi:hypothetical protein
LQVLDVEYWLEKYPQITYLADICTEKIEKLQTFFAK